MVVAKWQQICLLSVLGTILGGLFSEGLVSGYNYPAYAKRMLQTESIATHTKLTEAEQSWKAAALDDDARLATDVAQSMSFPQEAEFLDQIDKMQFFRGRQTSHKRSWPIPQLQCNEGCDGYEPSMVQCANVKSQYQDVAKWRCEADLPRHLKFQKTTINCEGYESAEDDKILRGSCGLEYSLTNSGLKQIPGRVRRHYYTIQPNTDENRGWTASWTVVVGVVTYLIRHNWNSLKSPVTEAETLRAKVATAHQAWKRYTTPVQPRPAT